jgi:ribosomal protein S18 acetylase RimI-like enzyme
MNFLRTRYPRTLEDGLTLRPLEGKDERALVAFFQRIPVDERQLFKDDVTQVSVIRGWIKNLNYQNILPLLAFDGAGVVGDATLHRDRRGWSRHVGKIRITLDTGYRRRGLAKTLVQEFIELAKPLNLAILQAEVLDVQQGARSLFEDLGFHPVATLPQHAIDLSDRVHDILVYELTVTPPERLAPEAMIKEEDGDIGGDA